METNYFDVYVGNLSISISKKHLSELFSQAGDVLSVWTQPAFTRKYTYAFAKFSKLESAKNACELLNNQNIDGLVIKVSLSIKTQQRLNTKSSVRKKTQDASIICKSMPRVEPGLRNISKETQLQEILRQNLELGIKFQKKGEHFMESFTSALTDMKEIPDSVGCDLFKSEAEEVNIETLESIVIRYHQPFKKHILFKEVDFDLSNNRTLNREENRNYFKLLASSHNI